MDAALFEALNRSAANPLLDAIFPTLTNLHKTVAGASFLGIWLLYLILKRPHYRQAIGAGVLAVALADISSSRVLKRLLDRPRPCHVLASTQLAAVSNVRLVPGTECPGSNSFPSNHAANTMAAATVAMFALRRKLGKFMPIVMLWLLLPGIIGYTRIYLGFHYPSDVAAGWALGACCGWSGWWGVALRPSRKEPEQAPDED